MWNNSPNGGAERTIFEVERKQRAASRVVTDKEEIMNKAISSLFALGAAALCVSAAPGPRHEGEEAKLAAALANYAPDGPTTDCVSERQLGDNRSVGQGTIIFNGTSSYRLWVNHPSGGCPNLNGGLALVFHTPVDRLCRGDIAGVVDPVSHINYGGCILGDFTPYHRVDRH
jgi:hypothetical protein